MLHVLPEELRELEAMFRAIGVRSEFDGADYVLALARLAMAAGGAELEKEQACLPTSFWLRSLGVRLSALKPCSCCQVALAGRLAKEAAQFELTTEARRGILLPDAHGSMLRAEQLVYDDAPWSVPTP